MANKFVIWVEDEFGMIIRAFTWSGNAREGVARAHTEALAHGKRIIDVWATPVANYNSKAMH